MKEGTDNVAVYAHLQEQCETAEDKIKLFHHTHVDVFDLIHPTLEPTDASQCFIPCHKEFATRGPRGHEAQRLAVFPYDSECYHCGNTLFETREPKIMSIRGTDIVLHHRCLSILEREVRLKDNITKLAGWWDNECGLPESERYRLTDNGPYLIDENETWWHLKSTGEGGTAFPISCEEHGHPGEVATLIGVLIAE